MALQNVVEQTVVGLGYELVEVERSAGGLLRVTIDWPWEPSAERFINVEDCERVTRQLQYALEVDGAEYARLEVSSPGIDRPLRRQRDFERFVGETIDVVLKAPIGAEPGARAAGIGAGRKKFRGTLQAAEGGGWQLVWSDEPAAAPGRKTARRKEPPVWQVLGFALDELKEARLAPVVDFKGRKPKAIGS